MACPRNLTLLLFLVLLLPTHFLDISVRHFYFTEMAVKLRMRSKWEDVGGAARIISRLRVHGAWRVRERISKMASNSKFEL